MRAATGAGRKRGMTIVKHSIDAEMAGKAVAAAAKKSV